MAEPKLNTLGLDELREMLIDGIQELLEVAKRLSKENAEFGAAMLMSAAAALVRQRNVYLQGAEESFDYMKELLELQNVLHKFKN